MRSVETKLLRAFVEVARTRSFAEAAVNLAISRPALSLQIIKLERQLEFPLLARTTRSVSLTEEGAQLLPMAQRVTADHELLAREIERMRTGSGVLRIGVALHTSRWSLRNRLLDDFSAAHPAVQLHVETGLQKNLLLALESGKIDALIFGGLPTTRADYERRMAQRRRSEGLYPDDLKAVIVDSIPLELLTPIESPLASVERIDSDALNGITVGLPSPLNCPPLYGRFAEFLTQAGGTPQVLSDHDAYSLDQFCQRRRLPVVWVGRLATEPTRHTDVVSRGLGMPELRCDLTLLSRADDRAPAVRALIAFTHRMRGGRVPEAAIG